MNSVAPRSVEAFEAQLKCIICKTGPKFGKTHWYRCMDLHQICQDCKEVDKLEKCVCSKVLSNTFDKLTENWLNDQTMKFQCENKVRGCQEFLGGENLVIHQTECIYKVEALSPEEPKAKEAKRPSEEQAIATISPPVKKIKGGRVCCAVDCHERQGQDPSISFFKVKSKRNPSRSEAWIRAIKRDNEDGTPWQPTEYSVLCGRHFISGKPSDIPSSPDYAPTIFSTGHCKPATMQDVERLNRRIAKITTTAVPSTRPAGPQTELQKNTTTVGTQARPNFAHRGVGTPHPPIYVTKDKQTMTDLAHNLITSQVIKNDRNCRIMLGISIQFFNQTLMCLKDRILKSTALTPEDQLTMYFIKLKTGLPFTMIGIFFGIKDKTVSKHFEEILNCHYNLAKGHLWWLSKEEVMMSMPESFKNSKYSKTRVIIDASEIKIQCPKEVDAAILCYSSYKANHTAKFLIGKDILFKRP